MGNRPFELDELFKSLAVLPGVGAKNIRLLERLTGGSKIIDLLFHMPVEFIDRKMLPSIDSARSGQVATLEVTVGKHFPNTGKKGRPYRIWCHDDTGTINVVFFHAHKDWIQRQLPEGQKRVISGRVEMYQEQLQMPHPDIICKPGEASSIDRIEPVYPLTAGIANKTIRKLLHHSKRFIVNLPEWIDKNHMVQNGWTSWKESLLAVHYPDSVDCIDPSSKYRERLAYDELLANQLALALVRYKAKKQNGRAWNTNGTLRKKLLEHLPFKLTEAQKQAIMEIDDDMKSPSRMLRLLQGDVGSGKTVVAAIAMLNVVESGSQAAIMAPTEILARQHEKSIKPWMDALGLETITLTGRDKGKARNEILQKIKAGSVKIIIGTHALFQNDVEFADLGLAVIDEQHRFGVHQRLQLSSKSRGCDILVMTATPIPRTLALTAYGDMEISRIREKPKGRKPVDTRLIPQHRIDEIITALAEQINKGNRVYWVCPLVEESKLLDLQAAEDRYDILKNRFGEDRVGLVHGRMKAEEKDEIMEKFAKGDITILVATTVIEVGVDVPEANIMVIEQAERYGLAQLHQLRGRVGRGKEQSFCFLIYSLELTETARQRLKTMRNTDDGFLIAEKDLQLRGGGEILGTRQSGMPDFRLADMELHANLLEIARDDAKLIIKKDANLETPRGKALKTLLYLFEQDRAIANLRAG